MRVPLFRVPEISLEDIPFEARITGFAFVFLGLFFFLILCIL